jgi:hypothetical protein
MAFTAERTTRYCSLLIIDGTPDECIKLFMTRPASTRHLYEIHRPSTSIGRSVLSGEDVVELGRLRDFL